VETAVHVGRAIGREGWVLALARDFLKVFFGYVVPFGLLCGLAGDSYGGFTKWAFSLCQTTDSKAQSP
jgi:hypothetical protein